MGLYICPEQGLQKLPGVLSGRDRQGLWVKVAWPPCGRGMETQAPTMDMPLWPGLGISKMEKTIGSECELGLSSGYFWGGGPCPLILAHPGLSKLTW